MCIIERRTTANHAEYGPIVAHMDPLFAEMGLKSEPISVPGSDDWARNRPSADYIACSPPGDAFYASWGTERLKMLLATP